jgi:hypothetical protein
MVNDFFMQDETATVLTFDFGERTENTVELDMSNIACGTVYFDTFARYPTLSATAPNQARLLTFGAGRHYVTLINNTALAGVNYSSFITVGKEYLIGVKISTLVNDIGANAFSGCTALKKADIPFSATGAQRRIGNVAFQDCPLEEVKIPEGFTEVGYECFNEVTAKEIELPTTLSGFAGFSFSSANIEKIICKNTNPVWTTPEEEPFTNALLIVPHDSVETYKSIFGYDKVEAYAYQTDIPNVKWKLLGETEITQAMIDEAGADGRAVDAVEGLGEDASAGGFADAARPGEEVSVPDAVRFDRVRKGPRDRFLADEFAERLRTITSSDDLVSGRRDGRRGFWGFFRFCGD